ncbi:MAG: response regulator [Betaproteobacteria bacterium]|nr:response regulator [Betaproteobacteria bacterium]
MKDRQLRLLIVEDEPGDARLMQLAMQKNDYAVELHGARDGFEALRFLRREGELFSRSPRPDMILLDLKMPGLSGLEFLAQIKQDGLLRAIPVVIITTSALDADVAAAYALGAAGYIPKPTDINEFVTAIRKFGEYWFKLVRLPDNPA